ncbi:hypothetical protein, partial [Escherichia coli]
SVKKNTITSPAGKNIKNQRYVLCWESLRKGNTRFAETSTIPAKIPIIVNGFFMWFIADNAEPS